MKYFLPGLVFSQSEIYSKPAAIRSYDQRRSHSCEVEKYFCLTGIGGATGNPEVQESGSRSIGQALAKKAAHIARVQQIGHLLETICGLGWLRKTEKGLFVR